MIDALGDRLANSHVSLVTGLKHYLGPFEAYGAAETVITPFREEQPRQPVDNFIMPRRMKFFRSLNVMVIAGAYTVRIP